jgi:DNA-binding CsgD family transcriptional regulator
MVMSVDDVYALLVSTNETPAVTRHPVAPPRRPALSPRERHTLSLIARGYTHQQAATRMGISKATVDTYVARIRAKLKVGNKAELAVAALRYVEWH